jgi:hypothetical protein
VKLLSNNADLYQYLQFLSKTLEDRHAKELGEAVDHASRTAAGNISTEFLGESRIALRRLIKEEHGILTNQEREDVKNVLSQIDGAFDLKKYRA